MTVHGLLFRRAYYRKDICVCDLGGLLNSGGLIFAGVYYQDFTIFEEELHNIRLSEVIGKKCVEWSECTLEVD